MRVLIPVRGLHGHIRPMIPLTLALQRAGHEVRFACRESMAPVVASAGLTGVGLFPDADFPASATALATTSSAEVGRLLAYTAQWTPDIVLREWAETAGLVVAVEHEVPCAVAGLKVRPGPPENGSHPCVGLMEDGLRGLLAGGGNADGFDLAKVAARHARIAGRGGGVTAKIDLNSLFGDVWLSFYPPTFGFPGTPALANEHHFRPPVFDALAGADLPPWWSELGDRPIVLGTLGTTVNDTGSLLERIVAAAAPLDADVVVTTGPDRDPATLGALPPNVHAARYIPLSAAMEKAAAAVIHGGFGTTMMALAHGVPVVCVPVNGDQPVNARRCADLGAGLAYGEGSGALGTAEPAPDPAVLREMLRRVLTEPSFRAAAGGLAADIAALPPIDDAVPVIESLVDSYRTA